MPSIKNAALTLLLGQVAQGWLLEFSNNPSCSPNDQMSEKGGLKKQGNDCMTLGMMDIVAMTVTDWDTDCRIILWPSLSCEMGSPEATEPILNLTMAEARDQKEALFDPKSGKACFRNLRGAKPESASYVCPDSQGSDDDKPKEPQSEPEPKPEEEPSDRTPDTQPRPGQPGKPKPQQPVPQQPEPVDEDGWWD